MNTFDRNDAYSDEVNRHTEEQNGRSTESSTAFDFGFGMDEDDYRNRQRPKRFFTDEDNVFDTDEFNKEESEFESMVGDRSSFGNHLLRKAFEKTFDASSSKRKKTSTKLFSDEEEESMFSGGSPDEMEYAGSANTASNKKKKEKEKREPKKTTQGARPAPSAPVENMWSAYSREDPTGEHFQREATSDTETGTNTQKTNINVEINMNIPQKEETSKRVPFFKVCYGKDRKAYDSDDSDVEKVEDTPFNDNHAGEGEKEEGGEEDAVNPDQKTGGNNEDIFNADFVNVQNTTSVPTYMKGVAPSVFSDFMKSSVEKEQAKRTSSNGKLAKISSGTKKCKVNISCAGCVQLVPVNNQDIVNIRQLIDKHAMFVEIETLVELVHAAYKTYVQKVERETGSGDDVIPMTREKWRVHFEDHDDSLNIQYKQVLRDRKCMERVVKDLVYQEREGKVLFSKEAIDILKGLQSDRLRLTAEYNKFTKQEMDNSQKSSVIGTYLSDLSLKKGDADVKKTSSESAKFFRKNM